MPRCFRRLMSLRCDPYDKGSDSEKMVLPLLVRTSGGALRKGKRNEKRRYSRRHL